MKLFGSLAVDGLAAGCVMYDAALCLNGRREDMKGHETDMQDFLVVLCLRSTECRVQIRLYSPFEIRAR